VKNNQGEFRFRKAFDEASGPFGLHSVLHATKNLISK